MTSGIIGSLSADPFITDLFIPDHVHNRPRS